MFYEQISSKQYMVLDDNKYKYIDNLCADKNWYNKDDITTISQICNKSDEFDDKLYYKILKTYDDTRINIKQFREYELFEPHIYEYLTKHRLSKLQDYWNKHHYSTIFDSSIKYYNNYGRRQYKLLNKLKRNPILINNENKYITYKDTRTGRLSNGDDSDFNIYNMKRNDRSQIIAYNDCCLIQFDFIACQIRLYFALTNNKLANEYDPYQKISDDINIDRERIKLYSFKKLFGGTTQNINKLSLVQNKYLNAIFDNKIYNNKECIIGSYIYDRFGRPILITSQLQTVIMNNIMQCTERNILMESACNVNEFIEGKRLNTKILFPFHDALIMMFPRHEFNYIPEIRDIIEDTTLCKMYTKLSIGKDFGNMSVVRDKRMPS